MKLSNRSLMLLLLTTTFISGCSFLTGENGIFHDKQADYTKASESNALIIPKDLDPREMTEYMNVPQTPVKPSGNGSSQQSKATFYAGGPPRAAKQLTGANEEVYSLRNSAEGVVLEAEVSLESAWPCIESYWEGLGVTLASSNVSVAIMDSGWLTTPTKSEIKAGKQAKNLAMLLDGADSDQQQRFRLVLKRGSQLQQVRITAQNTSKESSEEGEAINWDQLTNQDSHLEGRLLNQIMLHLAQCSFGDSTPNTAEEEDNTTEPEKISSNIKQTSIDGLSMPSLEVELAFSEAWEKVHEAMIEVGIDISDKDRSSGLFFVESESMSGLFEGFSDSTDSADLKDEMLTNDLLSSSYRLRLSKSDDGKTEVVLMQGSEPAPEKLNTAFLEKLKDALEQKPNG